MLMYLQAQSPGGGTVWKGLGGWPCWRRCITKVGFKVLKPMTGQCLSLCLLPSKQDIKLSATAPAQCLSVFHHDDHALTVTKTGLSRHSPPWCGGQGSRSLRSAHIGLTIRKQRGMPVCQCSAPFQLLQFSFPQRMVSATVINRLSQMPIFKVILDSIKLSKNTGHKRDFTEINKMYSIT